MKGAFDRSAMMGGASLRRLIQMLLAIGAAAHSPGSLEAQARVEGQVTEAGTGAPLAGVHIYVEGTNVGGLTDTDGRYLLRGVPSGTQVVVAQHIGYAPTRRTVSLREGSAQAADLVLHPDALGLGQVVVQGGGRSRLRHLFPVSALVGALLLMSLAEARGGRRARCVLAAAAGGFGAGVLFAALGLLLGGGSFTAPAAALGLPVQGIAIGLCLALWSARAQG